MLKFEGTDVLVDNIFYGGIDTVDDIWIFYPSINDRSFSAKELRQIADKLDELNE